MAIREYLTEGDFAKCEVNALNESSLSRVWKHATEHETGTITAFRYAKECGEGEKYTKSENKKRNVALKAKLMALGYGVTSIAGTYIENFKSDNEIEVKEDSFLVVDLKDAGNLKKDLVKLGTMFEQDSITFSKPSGEYVLISTNKCPKGYPGEGRIGVEVKLGKPLFGKKGEFHSKVNGRPFVFESIKNRLIKLTDYPPTEIRSFKMMDRLTETEMFEWIGDADYD
jgi:hypothetical protein